MTPEERRALQEAATLDELYQLLQAYLAAGKITQEEVATLYDEFGAPLEDAGDVLTEKPEVQGIETTNIPRIGSPGYLEYMLGIKRPVTPQVTPAVSPVDQYLDDPDIKAYLAQYTSPTDLADRISYLLGQGLIPDETTAGALYNRVLGKTASRKELDIAEANLANADPEDAPFYKKALESAQRKYEAAQGVLDQQASMLIRAGSKRFTDLQTKKRLTGVKDITAANLKAALNAPKIAAAKANYLPSLRIVLDNGVRSGTLTREQADQEYNYESSLIDSGVNIKDLPNYEQAQLEFQNTELLKQIEQDQILEQANKNTLRGITDRRLNQQQADIRSGQETGLNQLIDEYQRRNQFQVREAGIPNQPSYESVADPFLKTIGAPRFREFIRSQLGGIAEQTAGARAEWWKRKNPIEPMAEPVAASVPTFESLLSGARADVRERKDILSLVGKPGGVGAEQTDYLTTQAGLSEGRLADLLKLGQEGYYAQQQAIPRGVQTPLELKPTTEEDPFLTEIKRRYGDKLGFMSEFLSQSPEARGYQKSRYAPRVSFRGL